MSPILVWRSYQSCQYYIEWIENTWKTYVYYFYKVDSYKKNYFDDLLDRKTAKEILDEISENSTMSTIVIRYLYQQLLKRKPLWSER